MARKGVRALWRFMTWGIYWGTLAKKDTNWQRVGWSWIGKNCLGLSQEFHVNSRRVGCQLKSGISSDFMPGIFQNCLDSQHWMLSTCPVSFWFGFLALNCIKHLSIQYTWVVSKSQTPATFQHTCKDLTSQWEDLCYTFERNTFEQIRCFYLYIYNIYIYMYIILCIYITRKLISGGTLKPVNGEWPEMNGVWPSYIRVRRGLALARMARKRFGQENLQLASRMSCSLLPFGSQINQAPLFWVRITYRFTKNQSKSSNLSF